jgi:hypothetical protein
MLEDLNLISFHNIIVTPARKGKFNLLGNINKYVKNSFSNRHLKMVFSLEDSDGEEIDLLRQKFYNRVETKYHSGYEPKIAVKEIESWIIADETNLRDYQLIDYTSPDNPESLKEKPSEFLDKKFRKLKGKKYNKRIDGSNLLRTLNIEVVYNKCPSFKYFIDNVFTSLETDNPYLKLNSHTSPSK